MRLFFWKYASHNRHVLQTIFYRSFGTSIYLLQVHNENNGKQQKTPKPYIQFNTPESLWIGKTAIEYKNLLINLGVFAYIYKYMRKSKEEIFYNIHIYDTLIESYFCIYIHIFACLLRVFMLCGECGIISLCMKEKG